MKTTRPTRSKRVVSDSYRELDAVEPQPTKKHVEYVIAAYMGPRLDTSVREYEDDPSMFLATHCEQLDQLRHETLDGITIVINSDGHPREHNFDALTELNGTPVRVIHRPNVDLSYGAFVEAVQRTPHASHFIFMEDDFCFAQDDFDAFLFEKCPNGMLAGVVWDWFEGNWKKQPHAAVFLGIVTSSAVRTALRRGWHGQRVNREEPSSYKNAYYSQVAMSQAIFQAGFQLVDWLDDYATAFWNSTHKRVEWYHERNTERSLVVPIQACWRNVPILFMNRSQQHTAPDHYGRISWDGRIQ